jgi:hypothetical protein
VLYAAIGRRLGYPIYLCQANGHIFCRWQNWQTGEQFNIEGTGRGLNTFPDDKYMNWPRPIKPADVTEGRFLRNLNFDEEFALFMTTRGHCLRDRGLFSDAIVAYAHAHHRAPTDPHHVAYLNEAIADEVQARVIGVLPGTPREAENHTYNHPAATTPKRTVLNERFHRAAGAPVGELTSGKTILS